jgi:pimeloyl-ACP methyl ester carboxylesterase
MGTRRGFPTLSPAIRLPAGEPYAERASSRRVWNARPLIYISLIVTATTCASAARAQRVPPVPTAAFMQGGEYRLYTQAFAARGVSQTPALVVVLHGDSPRGAPKYHYRFAVLVANQNTDIVAVGLLRPGYVDTDGNKSDGERGLSTGDNYNARNTDSIADGINELKRRWHARKVVVVGHSGGAALTANILGRHPAVIDSAVLVSCPCDVEKWRQHMFQVRRAPIWQGEIDTLSPVALMPRVSDRVPEECL